MMMLINPDMQVVPKNEAIGERAVNLYLRQFSNQLTINNTVSTLRRIFDIFAKLAGENTGNYNPETRHFHFAWQKMSYDNILLLRKTLEQMCSKDELSPQTANKYLSTIKGMAKALMLADVIEHTAYVKIGAVRNIETVRTERGRVLETDEIKNIISILLDSGDANDLRNAAMILVGIQCALRSKELTKIKLSDFNLETGEINVIGKGRDGGKQIVAYATGEAMRVIKLWLDVRGDQPGLLFCATYNGLAQPANQLKQGSFWVAIKRFCEEHNIEPFTVHDLKRTGINIVYDVTDDIGEAQFIAHHSNPQTTTKHYIRANKKRIRARYNRVNGLTGVFE